MHIIEYTMIVYTQQILLNILLNNNNETKKYLRIVLIYHAYLLEHRVTIMK